MMALAAQYSSFLRTAAGQAEQAAGQASVAASAFEAALVATVQPAVVAANRALVQVLAATNWLGQNAPAIMDIESAYEQMWALDVVAMSGYHYDASQAAERLAPWRQVLQTIGATQAAKTPKNGGTFNILGLLGGSSSGAGTSPSSGGTNLGYGNTGLSNIGFGNLGNSNIGFGNTGNFDIGFGLTGDHQIGFGGFNSGSGNIGFGNSGTGNIGFFNSGTGNVGIGNSGSFNSGILNSGATPSGTPALWSSFASQTNPESGLLAAGNYATGASINAANIAPGVLNSVGAGTGVFNPGLASPALPSPGIASSVVPLTGPTPAFTPGPAAAAFDAGAPSVAPASAPTVPSAVASLRTPSSTGFYNSAGNDSGSRTTTSREPDVGNSPTNGAGIPSSGFFKSELGSNVIPLFRQPTHTD